MGGVIVKGVALRKVRTYIVADWPLAESLRSYIVTFMFRFKSC